MRVDNPHIKDYQEAVVRYEKTKDPSDHESAVKHERLMIDFSRKKIEEMRQNILPKIEENRVAYENVKSKMDNIKSIKRTTKKEVRECYDEMKKIYQEVGPLFKEITKLKQEFLKLKNRMTTPRNEQ
jgi:chromosome segregation ATPase